MKVVEMNEIKEQVKRNKIEEITDAVLKVNEEHGIDTLITVYKRKDGRLGVITTYANGDELVGLLELGKMDLIEEMYAEE